VAVRNELPGKRNADRTGGAGEQYLHDPDGRPSQHAPNLSHD
jgi:hypothetical protein